MSSWIGLILVVLLPAGALRALSGRDLKRAPRVRQRLGLRAVPWSLDEFLTAHRADALCISAKDSRCGDALAVKTLLFACEEPHGYALAILAEAERVDEVQLANAVGAVRVRLAPREIAEEVTGFAMGTLPPVGARCADVPTVVDSRLASSSASLLGGGGQPARRLLLSASELSRLASIRGARSLVSPIAAPRAVEVAVRNAALDAPASSPRAALAQHTARELPAVDIDGQRVLLSGMVAAKRPMARTLCFVTLLPHPRLLPPELSPQPGWDAPRALWRPVGSCLGPDAPPVGVQLVLGKALESRIGKERLALLIRQVRVGNELSVVAAPANMPPPTGAAAPRRVFGRLREWLARRHAAAALRRSIRGARQVDLKVLEVVRLGESDLFGPNAAASGLMSNGAMRAGGGASATAARPAAPRQAAGGSQQVAVGGGEEGGRAGRLGLAANGIKPWLTLPATTRVLVASDERSALEAARLLAAIVDEAEAAGAAASAEDADAAALAGAMGAGAEASAPGIEAAEAALAGQSSSGKRPWLRPVLGVDVEWQPERKEGSRREGAAARDASVAVDGFGLEPGRERPRERHRPALLQLASRDTVLLLDLLALCAPPPPLPLPTPTAAAAAATTARAAAAAVATMTAADSLPDTSVRPATAAPGVMSPSQPQSLPQLSPQPQDADDAWSFRHSSSSEGTLPAELSAALSRAFGSRALVKLSLGGGSDFRRLREGYPCEPSFCVPFQRGTDPSARSGADPGSAFSPDPTHYVDIAEMASSTRVQRGRSAALPPSAGKQKGGRAQLEGLARLCERILGRPLDKSLQCAPWGERPLTAGMLEYAALDSHVLTTLYDRLLETEGELALAKGGVEPEAGAAPRSSGPEMGGAFAAGGDGLGWATPEEMAWREAAQALGIASAEGAAASAAGILGGEGAPMAGSELRAAELLVRPHLHVLLATWLGSRVPRVGPAGAMHAKDAALLLASFPSARSPVPDCSARVRSAPVSTSEPSPRPEATQVRVPWVPPALAVRAYDRRSGLVEIGDAFVVFISFPPSVGKTYFDRKYPNALRWAPVARADLQAQQLELSWWLPSNVGEGHPTYAQLLGLASAQPRERLLFARVGRGAFVFCGRLRFARHLDEGSAGLPGSGIAWALEDAHALLAGLGANDGSNAFAQIMSIALRPPVEASD